MIRRRERANARVVLLAAALLGGCGHDSGGSTAGPPPNPQPGMDMITALPLGDVAGAAENRVAPQYPNPYDGDVQAVREGRELFIRMNCAGCHGYTAKGGMGPNLTDGYWRYGGVPVSLFKSIYEGRPQGMPAWNPALPPQEIWKIVAYLQSLGGTYPAAGYQAAIQGDRPGQNVAPETTATYPPGDEAKAGAKSGGGTPPSVAPTFDTGTPPGAKQ